MRKNNDAAVGFRCVSDCVHLLVPRRQVFSYNSLRCTILPLRMTYASETPPPTHPDLHPHDIAIRAWRKTRASHCNSNKPTHQSNAFQHRKTRDIHDARRSARSADAVVPPSAWRMRHHSRGIRRVFCQPIVASWKTACAALSRYRGHELYGRACGHRTARTVVPGAA